MNDAIAAPLAAALSAKGYETLTPVQQAMLAPEMAGRDALVSAQTGSGKTVAFGIAIAPDLLQGADRLLYADTPAALIIAPTRELALQVARELDWLYAPTGALIATCVGGMDYRTEKRALDRGAHIVVGTPGRLRDHIDRGSLDLSGLRAAVLDEADEMLDLGFREDLEFILAAAPPERRTLMFSATVPPAIAALAKDFQRDALRIQTQGEARQHVDIEYRALNVSTRDREHAIFNVLRFYEARTAIVFCKTRANVNHLFARMGNRGFQVVALSGELSQQERTSALQALRDGRARICIATDVAARGIDLPGLDLVIHADLPSNSETLLHRSGRTGRAGQKGVSALIVTPPDFRKAQRLLQGAKVVAEWAKAPSADEVRARDDVRLLENPALAQEVTEDEQPMVAAILKRFGAEQAAAAFARLWRESRSAPEELTDTSGPASAAPKPRAEFGPSVWFTLSVGRSGRAEARWLLPKICDAGGITKDSIGAIRVQEDQTFVQIAVSEVSRFGQGLEIESGVILTRVDGEPDLDALVKPRAKPRAAKPYEPKPDHKPYEPKAERKAYEPKPDRKPYIPKPPREDAPEPYAARAPAPRPFRDDAAPATRKPYDPDRKPYGSQERKERSERAKYDSDRKPLGKREDGGKPLSKRADGDRKPYPKPSEVKPFPKRDGAKPFGKRAEASEGAESKPRWKGKAEGSKSAAPNRAAGSKSHGKPAFGKKPAPRASDPSDTSKRFVPPKKPRG
ncbi:MAG: DEAD/DEAH box helicase [Cereibacter sphaeroides]|uniref:DEAD/DEAH box helicase n=1 Tax=Cereibacter sphaeroides TaxID=1063 RepID=A0A2W5RXR8_CERSP|nr:MAG: DEAD/DEAH box helicase [Cereibacter sphaeroides]